LHSAKDGQYLFWLCIFLSLLLIFGFWVQWVSLALVILGVLILKQFQGPYNGGSDRMSYLTLCCLCLIYFAPTLRFKEFILGYLALQLLLSYFISGWFKIVNPNWRNGNVLKDIFLFSNYPVSDNMRAITSFPTFLNLLAWGVISFELIFPFLVLNRNTLFIGLIIASLFHLSLVFLFGLNRFFWAWLAAYPSVLWLQEHLFVNT
jgi:hypothetical protein